MRAVPDFPYRGALCVAFWLLSLPTRAAGASAESWLRYDGQARAPNTAALRYAEQHLLHMRDGVLSDRIVLYTCADGHPFARKLLHYSSTPLAPDVRFDDARTGELRNLETTGTGRRVVARDSARGKPITVTVPADDALVADAGFDEFIRRSWSRLMSNEPVAFNILLLSDGSTLHLKASHLQHTRLGTEEVDVFRVRLSGLFGLVAPNIDVSYDSVNHVLRRFEGISNIRDARGRQAETVIDFPAGARVAANASDWSEAMTLPLVSRCPP